MGGAGMGQQQKFPEFRASITRTTQQSVSKTHDSGLSGISVTSESACFMEDAFSASTPPPNEADGLNCTRCSVEFKQTLRRHHCRSCGRNVCHNCSPHMVLMPLLQVKGEQRACVDCFEMLDKGKASTLERVFALMQNAEDESVQMLAGRELMEYCAVADGDIPEKVVEALLHQCGMGGEMATVCLSAITRMAQKANNKRMLRDKGAIVDIVGVLRNMGSSSPDIQVGAIEALRTLAAGDLTSQNAIREADGIGCIVPLLTGDPSVQQTACKALQSFVGGCSANAKEVCTSQGGIQFLLPLLSSPVSDVRTEACSLLQTLMSGSDEAHSQIMGQGGVKMLLHSVHDPSLQSTSLRLLHTLANGAASSSFVDHFMRDQGVASLLQLLLNCSDTDTLSDTLQLLAQVANDPSAGIGDLLHEANYMGAMPRLLQSSHPGVRAQAAFLCKLLSFSERHNRAPLDVCVSLMTVLLGVHDMGGDVSSFEAKVLAAESLRNFARWPHNTGACWESMAGARHMLPRLVELLGTATSDGGMEGTVAAFLACLTSNMDGPGVDAQLALLHEAGVHRALIAAMSSQQLVTQRGAAHTLANIMQDSAHSRRGQTFRHEVFDFGTSSRHSASCPVQRALLTP